MKTLIALACCLLVWSQAALGHAVLVATSPAAGAVLAQAPQQLILKFNEPVRATALRLFDPKGRLVPLSVGNDGADGLALTLPAGAAGAGTYLLNWRVLSQDGRPVGGRLDYSVGTLSPLPAAALATGSAARDTAIWLARWLTYLCLFGVCGAALARVRRPDTELRGARPLVWLGLVALLADLALHGLDLLDVPWTALWSAAPWEAALSGAPAWSVFLMALALLAGGVALRARRPLLLGLGAGAGALLPGLALAVEAAPPAWTSRLLVVLHVLVAILWVGALVPLYRTLQPRIAGAARPDMRLAGRIHPLAWFLGIVLPLAVTGLWLAVLRLSHWGDLWRTDRGNVLLATLILAVVLVFVAARNRWRLAAGVQGSVGAQSRVRRGLGTECILVAGLLSVVALAHFAAPPAAQVAADEPQGPVVTLENHQIRALIELPVLPAGPWRIGIISIQGATLTPQRVTLTLGNPALGIEPFEHVALHQPDGRWRVDLPALPAGGQWHVRVDVMMGDFNQITLERELTLPLPQGAAAAPRAAGARP